MGKGLRPIPVGYYGDYVVSSLNGVKAERKENKVIIFRVNNHYIGYW